ncbi:deazapurine DNA modification protein DpdA family protein [Haloarchaeobius baliensis]|uniref:deazapurine DNA modification protein DpdA family protein n=1 Tax=Haloarchaeobius baliensis TaxID=1670458 RepID=UPI003F885481
MADSIPEIEWYDGAASGQQRSALMRMQPDRIMISHATACNRPWDNKYHSRSEYTLFVDSGGFSHMMQGTGEYETSDDAYLSYLNKEAPAYWALRDYPCEPGLLEKHDRTVSDHIDYTVDHHVRLLDAASEQSIPGQPIAVLQGWTVDEYLKCFEALRDRGALTNYLGIGSVCRRHQPEEVARIIVRLHEALPGWVDLHAFGVKNEVLQYSEVLDALRSADSGAYAYAFSRHQRQPGESFTFRDAARGWLTWRRRLRELSGTMSLDRTKSPSESTDRECDRTDQTVRDRVWTAMFDLLRSNAMPVSTRDIGLAASVQSSEFDQVEATLQAIASAGWVKRVEEDEEVLWLAGPTAIAEFES